MITRVRLDLTDVLEEGPYNCQWTSFRQSCYPTVSTLIQHLTSKFGLPKKVLLYLNEVPFTLPPGETTSELIQNGDLIIVRRREPSEIKSPSSKKLPLSKAKKDTSDEKTKVHKKLPIKKPTQNVQESSSSDSDSSDEKNPVPKKPLSKKPTQNVQESSSSDSDSSDEKNPAPKKPTQNVQESSSSDSDSSDEKQQQVPKKLIQSVKESSSTSSDSDSSSERKENSPPAKKPMQDDDSSPKKPPPATTTEDPITFKTPIELPPTVNGQSDRKRKDPPAMSTPIRGKKRRRGKKRNQNALPSPTCNSSSSMNGFHSFNTPALSKNSPDVTCESVILLEDEGEEAVSRLGLDVLVNGGCVHLGARRNGGEKSVMTSSPSSEVDLPSLLAPPGPGDTLVFKVLELSESYNPTLSGFKRGNVLSFDGENIILDMKTSTATYLWKDLIDVRS